VTINTPSLIPYLDSKNSKFYLELSSWENTAFPFSLVSEIPPLARIIDGCLMTDGGSKIKKIFILLQNDEYPLLHNEFQPFNNRNIEQCWEKSFSYHTQENQAFNCFILADQVGKEKKITPFSSLFYCKSKKIFFHPPCPQCGQPLELCKDDALLIDSGLQTYSESIRRYLFCPTCTNSASSPAFYTYSLKNFDPPWLKDRWGLIRSFGLLRETTNVHSDVLPCSDCSDFNQCYGDGDHAVSRIIPFSFYPFFMLISESESLNALDFLALISGAGFDEIEQKLGKEQQFGRIRYLQDLQDLRNQCGSNTLFFFEKDEKFFLEVLFLKLSFLGEIVSYIFSGLELYTYPDLGLSLSKVWVKFAEQSELLPFFWNYRVKFLDMGGDTSKSPYLPKVPPSYGLYLLGTLWFYVLSLNKNQDVTNLYSAVDLMIKEHRIDTAYFSPENIFWEPKQKDISGTWQNIWKRTLDLGYKIIKASQNADSNFSKTIFKRDLEILRDEIKGNMFALSSRIGEKIIETENLQDDQMYAESFLSPISNDIQIKIIKDLAIKDILHKITDRWSETLKQDKIQSNEWDDDMQDTICISSEDFEKVSDLSKKEKSPDFQLEGGSLIANTENSDSENSEWNDMPGTTILSPGNVKQDNTVQDQAEKDQSHGTDISDTEESEWNDLPGTTILSQENIKQAIPGKKIEKNMPDSFDEDDLMSQTIIIRQEDLEKITNKE